MKFKSVFIFALILAFTAAAFAQNDITISKKTTVKIPGVDMSKMPGSAKNPLEDKVSVVYIKGSRMRSEQRMNMPKPMGGTQTITQTSIMQCDKQRNVTFNNRQKVYYVEPFGGVAPATVTSSTKKGKPAKEVPTTRGGYVTITGSVTDTGERAKLFGYESRHLKQTMTITPSPGACQKEIVKVEIEGWYADLPEFSCPSRRHPRDIQGGTNCYDELVDEFKGAVTGVALKEVKKITIGGQTFVTEEEATSLSKSPLADTLFEPPIGYTAVNTLKEVDDPAGMDSSDNIADTSSSPSFAPPAAGIEKAAVTGEKKPDTIRIGIAKPKVTTPESKKDPNAGADIAAAVGSLLQDSLKSGNVEAFQLVTDSPENECKEKSCDYIFYANVNQKRGGGGMFGKMLAMGAASMAGAMIPGVGGIVASTVGSVVMGQTMGKAAKAKDEFALDYKVMGLDNSVLSQGTSKSKTKEDGEDVVTPQIQTAAKAVLAEVAKKAPAKTP